MRSVDCTLLELIVLNVKHEERAKEYWIRILKMMEKRRDKYQK